MLARIVIFKDLLYDSENHMFLGNSFFFKPLWSAYSLESLRELGFFFKYANYKFLFRAVRRALRSQSLGFKMFIHHGEFFIDVGFSHFCLLRLPFPLRAICRKKKMYLETEIKEVLDWTSSFKRVRRFSRYKSKELMPLNRIKYLRLLPGKKQQI